jgi:hypothetical protein
MKTIQLRSVVDGIRKRKKVIYAVTLVTLSLFSYNVVLSQLGSFTQAGVLTDPSMEYISSVENTEDRVDIRFQVASIDTIREFAIIEYGIEPYGSYGYQSNESSHIKSPIALQYSASGHDRHPSSDISSWIHLPSEEWIGGFEAPVNLYPCPAIGQDFSNEYSSAGYPSDKYCFDVLVNIYDETVDAAGEPTTLESYPTTWLYHYGSGIDGYQITLTRLPYYADPCDSEVYSCSISTDSEVGLSRVTGMIERTGVVQIFTWVVIGMIILAAICAITITLAVMSGARPPALEGLAFLAALLFAVQPLRSALPDAPPVGMDLDVRIFYPCILAILVSLAVQVGLWVRRDDYRA